MELFFQHMRKPNHPHRAAFFPPVIYSDYPVGAFRHIPAPPGIHAWVVFLLHYDHLRTRLQHFVSPPLLIQAVQALLVRDNGDKLQSRILFLLFQYDLCKILFHTFPKPAYKAGIAVSRRTVDFTPQGCLYIIDFPLGKVPVPCHTAGLFSHCSFLRLLDLFLHSSQFDRLKLLYQCKYPFSICE